MAVAGQGDIRTAVESNSADILSDVTDVILSWSPSSANNHPPHAPVLLRSNPRTNRHRVRVSDRQQPLAHIRTGLKASMHKPPLLHSECHVQPRTHQTAVLGWVYDGCWFRMCIVVGWPLNLIRGLGLQRGVKVIMVLV